jgi:hypothetical protein
MASTRSIRQGQIEVGVLENNGHEYAAFGSMISKRSITAYLKKDRRNFQLTRWDGTIMLACRCEVVKEFWSGSMALMFRLPRGRFVVGYGLGSGMLFRGELIDGCTQEEARSHAWMIADNFALLDSEDEEAEVKTA